MLINQQNLITLQRGLKTVFQDGLNYDFQNVSDLLCTKVKSTGDGENYSWVEELGQLSEFVDELDLSNLQAKSFYIENKMYAKGITIDVNLVEDDKFDIIKSKVTQGLSSQTGRHTDIALKMLFRPALTMTAMTITTCLTPTTRRTTGTWRQTTTPLREPPARYFFSWTASSRSCRSSARFERIHGFR